MQHSKQNADLINETNVNTIKLLIYFHNICSHEPLILKLHLLICILIAGGPGFVYPK